MIITRKAIPRRTVLRGLGATLALPLLDGMVPALTALQKTAGQAGHRFGVDVRAERHDHGASGRRPPRARASSSRRRSRRSRRSASSCSC